MRTCTVFHCERPATHTCARGCVAPEWLCDEHVGQARSRTLKNTHLELIAVWEVR